MESLDENNCEIERVIVHLVDRAEDAPTLSDSMLELTQLPSVILPYLKKHVTRSINRSVLAKFVDKTTNIICTDSERSFSDPDGAFITTSQHFATELHKEMRTRNAKAGTLWFLIFQNTDPKVSTDGRGLALLKMDKQNGLSFRPAVINGKRTVALDVNPNSLPDTTGRLNKAAFIFPQGQYPDYDLKVLDENLAGEEVAEYFTRFLGYKPARDAVQTTNAFQAAIKTFAENKDGELRRLHIPNLLIVQHGALQNSEVDIPDLVDKLFDSTDTNESFDQTREDLRQELKEALVTAVGSDRFYVDAKRRRTEADKITIELKDRLSSILIRGTPADLERMIPNYATLPAKGSITIHFDKVSVQPK